jgi:hypothetical protein
VKNITESKDARRMLVEGNVIEGVWRGEVDGFAFVLKSDVDLNTPWPIRSGGTA